MKKKSLGLILLTLISSVALSACWLFKTTYYTVNFYASIDNYVFHTEQVKKNAEFTYPEAPYYPGYTFASWSEEIHKVTEDLNVRANYVANKYNITLNYSIEGKDNKVVQVTYDQPYSIETPGQDGYEFVGWYDAADKLFPNSGTYKVAMDSKLTAKWNRLQYSVTYVLDGGTNNADNPKSVLYTDSITLKDATKENHTFKGWYSDANFTNQVTTLSKVTADVTLYAKFELIEHDVKFFIGDNNFYSTKAIHGQTIKFESTYNYNPNNNFVGWYVDGQKIDLSTYKVNGPVNIYAKYNENCLYLKKGTVSNTFVIGNSNCSIIGFELTIKFKTGYNISVKDAGSEAIYNLKTNTLYMNVMFDENSTVSKDYLTLEINTNESVENIVDSYEIVMYERVNGTIKVVEKDFLIF